MVITEVFGWREPTVTSCQKADLTAVEDEEKISNQSFGRHPNTSTSERDKLKIGKSRFQKAPQHQDQSDQQRLANVREVTISQLFSLFLPGQPNFPPPPSSSQTPGPPAGQLSHLGTENSAITSGCTIDTLRDTDFGPLPCEQRRLHGTPVWHRFLPLPCE